MTPADAAAGEATADGAATPPRRGRRGRTRTPEASAAEPVAEDAASAEASPLETAAEPAPEVEPPPPDAQVEESAPATTRGRRTRGSRGGAGRRAAREVQRQTNGQAPPRQDAPSRTETPTQQRPRRESTAPPQRESGRGGSVEGLIARQNVLFEEFQTQQTQTLRDIQRAVRGLGGAQGIAGNMLALPKVGIFLDVPNLIYAAEQMGVRIDFGKLLDYLTEGRQLVRATAYAPITDDPMTRFEAQRFVAPVINHGYKIVTKSWKRFADGSMKANFDIELAVDILTMSDRLDIVVLLSGDGDFRRVCELVESKGVRVEVVAFAQSSAKELREVADHYIDLNSILKVVGA